MLKKQLLIIGNGFDLACGLPSKYYDFYDACFEKRHPPFDNFEASFWLKLIFTIKNNSSSIDYDWCDIEYVIYDTLKEIDSIIILQVYSVWLANTDPDDISEEDQKRRFITLTLISYLYNTLGRKRITINEVRKLINEFLFSELKKFERHFCEYLKISVMNQRSQQNPFDILLPNTYPVKALELFNTLFGFDVFRIAIVNNKRVAQVIAKNGVLEDINNLSFNYTNPLKYLGLGKTCLITNVHGTICNEMCVNCSGSDVIFGIDDKLVHGEKSSDNLRSFSKTYRKLFMHSNEAIILPDKRNHITVKFFGHSLNAADYSYFQSMFDYYDLYNNAFVILEFFYKVYDESQRQNITVTAINSVYKLINEYGVTLYNKDQGRNLIHKLMLENRIKITELDSANQRV